jgi:hypothetical protein
VIFEFSHRQTGELLAAFDAPSNERAKFRLRYEIKAEELEIDREDVRLCRAPAGAWPNIGTAQFHWLPKEQANGR